MILCTLCVVSSCRSDLGDYMPSPVSSSRLSLCWISLCVYPVARADSSFPGVLEAADAAPAGGLSSGLGPNPPSELDAAGFLKTNEEPRCLVSGTTCLALISSSITASSVSNHLAASCSCLRARIAAESVASLPPCPLGCAFPTIQKSQLASQMRFKLPWLSESTPYVLRS